MFDGIAHDYDRLNHIMSLGVDRCWRRRALRELPTVSVALDAGPIQVLDVACGTGDFSIDIARFLGRKAKGGFRVRGVDISEGMLAVMRQKVARLALEERVSMQEGDCEALPLRDGSIDAVTIAFGIRNFEHREAALREILRVLRPGGKLIILELSLPENRLLRWVYQFYFTRVMPLVGGWISGDRAAYRYLPSSVLSFPGREEWMETMRGCGFAKLRHRSLSFGICRLYVGEKAF